MADGGRGTTDTICAPLSHAPLHTDYLHVSCLMLTCYLIHAHTLYVHPLVLTTDWSHKCWKLSTAVVLPLGGRRGGPSFSPFLALLPSFSAHLVDAMYIWSASQSSHFSLLPPPPQAPSACMCGVHVCVCMHYLMKE